MEEKKTKTEKQKESACSILSEAEFLNGRLYKIENCYSEHGSLYNNRLHFHDFYELSAIYEGKSHFLVNGSLFAMEKRSIQLVRPADYHRQQTREGESIRYYNLTFSPDFLSEPLRLALEETQEVLCVNARAEEWKNILLLLQKLHERFLREPDTVLSRTYIHSGIEMLCVFLLDRHQQESTPQIQNAHEAVRRAIVFIRKKYRNPIRLEDAAAAAGLSPAYFSSVFHQTMGITFSGYLTEYRLQEAKRYLQTGELQVKQIAAICGFPSYSYFVTAFKDAFGCTPGKWKRR
ncbi:MAG TPA: hypothetical protein DCZ40_14915 [Lachnospiraceae bacterium]|nr:hypothetical protein [Lachnospiraceae bacterium]